jgi:hypothetical protein
MATVKLSLCLVEKYAMKTYGGVKINIFPSFFTSELDGDE